MAVETPTPMRLSLWLLGPFQATVGQEPLAQSRAKKIEALLAYLAFEADLAHRRENLVGLLFPEMPDEQARTNLRQTLTRLRRLIHDREAKPSFLLVSRESTQFNLASDHFLDVKAFQRLLLGCPDHRGWRDGRCPACMGRAQKAVDLYRGPFLAGFFLNESAAFDEWLLSQRERLREMALAAADQLATYYERRGQYMAAELAARRQIELEPWREEAYQQLMRLLAYQGKRGDALRQYERLAALLEEELGLGPLPATEQLRRQIAATAEARPHNLPPRDPSFVGRSDELAVLNEHLADPERRLVTLIGPGGCGKTALAVEAGWQATTLNLGPFIHGVVLVPLVGIAAPATSGDASRMPYDPLATAVADALDFCCTQDPQREVINYLNDKKLLLILDNAEHMIGATRDFVTALLRGAAMPKILVTSRARLNLVDEWLVEISGLPVPDLALSNAGEAPAAEDAATLFLNRARRLAPEITANGGPFPCPRPTIIRICTLVQGLPLGVELAAGWVRHLSCQEIAAELESSLDFLRTSAYDVPERHQSLRAVFDYSWSLLGETDRQTLRRLSIFSGPFDRPAAGAVTGATVSTLARLVDYSLLQRRAGGASAGQRYEFLESLRHFAAEKSSAADGDAGLVGKRYRRHYLGLLANRLEDLRSQRQQEAVQEIALEITNIRAAWRLAIDSDDFLTLAGAQESLAMFYYMRSWFAEGEASFNHAGRKLAERQLDSENELLRARLMAWQGWFAYLGGRSGEGGQLLEQSVATMRQLTATAALGATLPYLAVATSSGGEYATAERIAAEGQQICRQAGDIHGQAVAANVLSQISYLQNDYEQAQQLGQESLALLRQTSNSWSMAFSLTNLGRAAFAAADYEQARAYYGEAIAIREKLGDARGTALGLLYLGDAAAAEGQQTPAIQAYRASLAIFRDIGSRSGAARTLARLAHVARREGQRSLARQEYREALELAGQGEAIRPLLDTIRGMAALEAGQAPEEALLAARLVAGHPASGEATRNAAQRLMAHICDQLSRERVLALSPEEATTGLNDVVEALLKALPAVHNRL